MSETNKDHAEHGARRLADGWYAIHFCHECQQEAATDSKKLREPATCNAGHKSNLPLALWDCPVCTQFLRDNLQQVRKLLDRCKNAIEIAIYHDDGLDGAEGQDLIADIAKARALESALKVSP